jgi:hypothetical protein
MKAMKALWKQNEQFLILFGVSAFFLLEFAFASPDGNDTAQKNIVSLCNSGDYVYYSCRTGNKKFISLCGKGQPEQPEYIYYRFGKPDKVEMEFPEEKDKSSYRKFRYNHYFRYRTTYFNITFRNGSYGYYLYNDYDGDTPDEKVEAYSGIRVEKEDGSNKPVYIPCASDVEGGLGNLVLFLECNEEVNELGCRSKD